MSARFALVPLIALVALAFTVAQDATQTPVDAKIDGYLAAYARGDFDGLARSLAPEACFEDGDIEHVGRDAMLTGLRATFTGVTIDELALTERIHGGSGHVLCSGRVVFRMDGAALGYDGKEFRFDMPMAIALKFDGEGRIVRHVDYVDTPTFRELLQAQLAALAEDG